MENYKAASEWKKLYYDGNVSNPDVFPGAIPFTVILEFKYDDGSILRWSDHHKRWFFYENHHEFEWAQKLGRC